MAVTLVLITLGCGFINAVDCQGANVSADDPTLQSFAFPPFEQIADEVYLAALSRRPTAKERALVTKFYADHPDGRQAATEDFLWVILNSAEFMFNH